MFVEETMSPVRDYNKALKWLGVGLLALVVLAVIGIASHVFEGPRAPQRVATYRDISRGGPPIRCFTMESGATALAFHAVGGRKPYSIFVSNLVDPGRSTVLSYRENELKTKAIGDGDPAKCQQALSLLERILRELGHTPPRWGLP